MIYDFTVIGGGIVGLSTALAIHEKYPGASLAVLEKESHLAAHQSGRNSGVIHSGIYYPPGSLKATLAREGNQAMVQFCQRHGIPFEICGKIIVAVDPEELPRLENLYQRALANGLSVTRLRAEEAREREPHVSCLAALHLPSTGITDYRKVCQKMADLILSRGGHVFLRTNVRSVKSRPSGHRLVADQGDFECRYLINCAGLHSDRVAHLSGVKPNSRIIPFRGEYYELKSEKRALVKNLIYPVPDPDLPFLGVHFTRMMDGSIHAGPSAILALKREGYEKTDFSWRDAAEILGYVGFWKMAGRYVSVALQELRRSLSRKVFTKSLQRLVPEIQEDDLIPAAAGVRAQALLPNGQLMNDFYLLPGPYSLHVCNAPSPAATASISIGRYIAAQVPAPR